MKMYRVSWHIDIEAESDIEAAKNALVIQRDKQSTATYFVVKEWNLHGGPPEGWHVGKTIDTSIV